MYTSECEQAFTHEGRVDRSAVNHEQSYEEERPWADGRISESHTTQGQRSDLEDPS